ncbi:MAG: LptA/OstA family protein [Verrucomicrobiota bacterium]
MKDSIPFPSQDPSDEQFIDAALREHHRLGGADRDTELVQAILRETVERVDQAPVLQKRRREEQRLLLIGAVSAAAIVAALATLLAVLPFRSDTREVEEIRFVVQYAPEDAEMDIFSKPPPQKAATPLSAPVSFEINLSPVEPSVPTPPEAVAIQPSFSPTFSEMPEPKMAELRLEIESDETRHFDDRRIYEGNVEVRQENFRLSSEVVQILSPENGESDGQVRLISSQALLEQTSPMRRVLADSISYNPSLQRFTLKGIVFLETSEGTLDSFDSEDVVYLTSETLVVQKAVQASRGTPWR